MPLRWGNMPGFKVIDVVFGFILRPLLPSWCGINNSSPTGKGCVWINCDLELLWVTAFDVFVILIHHGRSGLNLSEKFMKESKLPFFVSELPLFLFQVVCNKGAHTLFLRKTCSHKVNHFRDSPYSEGLVVKQVNYFWFEFQASEGVRDIAIWTEFNTKPKKVMTLLGIRMILPFLRQTQVCK